jgi:hypothetical protein
VPLSLSRSTTTCAVDEAEEVSMVVLWMSFRPTDIGTAKVVAEEDEDDEDDEDEDDEDEDEDEDADDDDDEVDERDEVSMAVTRSRSTSDNASSSSPKISVTRSTRLLLLLVRAVSALLTALSWSRSMCVRSALTSGRTFPVSHLEGAVGEPPECGFSSFFFTPPGSRLPMSKAVRGVRVVRTTRVIENAGSLTGSL